MAHYQRFIFFILILLSSIGCLKAQSLTFTDLLKIYSLDSSAARAYCTGKGWNFTNAHNDGSATRYQYATTDSSQATLDLSYPNDSASLNIQLNYHFTGDRAYSRLSKNIKAAGFTRQAVKEVKGALPAHVERYISRSQQIELIHPEGKQPYWLFLHPVGNYTW